MDTATSSDHVTDSRGRNYCRCLAGFVGDLDRAAVGDSPNSSTGSQDAGPASAASGPSHPRMGPCGTDVDSVSHNFPRPCVRDSRGPDMGMDLCRGVESCDIHVPRSRHLAALFREGREVDARPRGTPAPEGVAIEM